MKNTLAVLIILLFAHCVDKNDKAHSSEFREFRFLNKNKKDSTIVKYLKDEESLLYKVKYNEENLMKVKKILKDGTFEKYQFNLKNSTPFGDFYVYGSDGNLLSYRYIDPKKGSEKSLFGYNYNDGSPVVKGKLLVEHFNYGDSIEFVFPLINFVTFDIKVREYNTLSKLNLNLTNYGNGTLMYKVANPKDDILIDIYAKGFYPDSVVHQHYKILSEFSDE
jgi:hypothetical protein